ncbi:MAG TPA: hypothetical protein VG826_02225 [Pirellulales bacterium]|nr:hypothetical protein [Pirellulales bacterium]
MSTSSTVPKGDVQQFIDQRLDAIDRALLGLLPRQDRLSIVTQVETRLRELTESKGADTAAETHEPNLRESATQADVRFDSRAEKVWAGLRPRRSATGRRGRRAHRKLSRLAVSSGVLGIVALALLFAFPISYLAVSYVGVMDVAAEVLLGTHVAAVALGGTLAVALSIAGLVSLQRARGEVAGHGWAITGLSTGPLPMFVGGLIVLVVGLQLLAADPSSAPQVTTTSVPVTVPPPAYCASAPPCAAPGPMPVATVVPSGYPDPVLSPVAGYPGSAAEGIAEAPPEADAPPAPIGDLDSAFPVERTGRLVPADDEPNVDEPPPQTR